MKKKANGCDKGSSIEKELNKYLPLNITNARWTLISTSSIAPGCSGCNNKDKEREREKKRTVKENCCLLFCFFFCLIQLSVETVGMQIQNAELGEARLRSQQYTTATHHTLRLRLRLRQNTQSAITLIKYYPWQTNDAEDWVRGWM